MTGIREAGGEADFAPADLADTDLDAMLAVNVRAPHVLVAAIAPRVVAGLGGQPVRGDVHRDQGRRRADDPQLGRRVRPLGVRVNTVAPGVTRTPGNEDRLASLEQMTAGTPAGSPVQPEDIAYAAAFLASDEARMVHGITLYVDGGITATRLT